MSRPQFFFVESDLLPDFPFKLEEEDEDGKVVGPIPLTDYSSIELRMRREDGELIVRPSVTDDAAEGEGHFEWAAGDLAQGRHEAEVVLTRAADSKTETIPAEEPMVFHIRKHV